MTTRQPLRVPKDSLREQPALAADALIEANELLIGAAMALREMTGLEAELDAAHAENIRLREAMRRPWWLRMFGRVK